MKIAKLLVGALMVAAPVASHAATTVVTDGSFEAKGAAGVVGNPAPVANYCYDAGAYGNGQCAGQSAWTGTSGVIKSGEGAWGGTTTPDGNYYAFVQGGGVLSQALTLTQGNYQVNWIDANRSGYGGIQSYTVGLGGSVSAPYTSAVGGFVAKSAILHVGAGGAQTLSFNGLSGANDNTAFIDGVSIAAVPEPAVWGMMILGFGIVGGALRRRKVAAPSFA